MQGIAGGICTPKSCLKILSLASANSSHGITQSEIIKLSRLSKRTVKYGLKKLVGHGLLQEQAVPTDLRAKIYFCKIEGGSK